MDDKQESQRPSSDFEERRTSELLRTKNVFENEEKDDKQQQQENTSYVAEGTKEITYTTPTKHTRLTAGNLKKLAKDLSSEQDVLEINDACTFDDYMQYVWRPHKSWDSALKEFARVETLKEINSERKCASQSSISAYSIANSALTARSSAAARKGHLGMLPLGGQTSNTINPPRVDTSLIMTGSQAPGVSVSVTREIQASRRGEGRTASVVSGNGSQVGSMSHISGHGNDSERGLENTTLKSTCDNFQRRGASNHLSIPQPIAKFQFQEPKNTNIKIKEVNNVTKYNDTIKEYNGGSNPNRRTTAVGPPAGPSGHVRVNSCRSEVFPSPSSFDANENCGLRSASAGISGAVNSNDNAIKRRGEYKGEYNPPSSSNSLLSTVNRYQHSSVVCGINNVNNQAKQKQQLSCTFGRRSSGSLKGQNNKKEANKIPPITPDLTDGLIIIGGIGRR